MSCAHASPSFSSVKAHDVTRQHQFKPSGHGPCFMMPGKIALKLQCTFSVSYSSDSCAPALALCERPGGRRERRSGRTPSSVRDTQTLKKERAEKDPEPSPADSAVAHPFALRHARMLPCPSCLYNSPFRAIPHVAHAAS